jgi:xanthine dehydrogenase YagS FAD-binding subunit
MQSFTFQTAGNVDEAIAGAVAGGRFIAGGTTLIDLMREEVERPSQLIDINRLPLRDVRLKADALIIGALARMADVAANPVVVETQPLIAQALVEGASPQLRNMASIGGNLLQRVRCPYFRTLDAPCNKRTPGSGCAALQGINNGHAILGASDHCVATHPSDLAVALVALDAVVIIDGAKGRRRARVEDLYRLPGKTPHLEHNLDVGDLLVAVEVPPARYARHTHYLKVRDRASYEFALASAAVALDIQGGVIRNARIAAGGVGTRPWRMRGSEQALAGERATHDAFERAGARALLGARPLSRNGYKVELLRRTIIRALEQAAEAA